MSPAYDVIVVGARCAGSPTAMLLARRGYKVLVVDRATFPSDTVSTHLVHPPGVDALARWGVLDRLVATGCPAIHTYAFDMGPFVISGTPGPGAGTSDVAFGPRRTVLDKLLVEAASEAGADVREPTHDDLTLVVLGWPIDEFETNKSDIESNFLDSVQRTSPTFAERLRAARREERFAGMAVPNFFRKPFGPGWALVGDAGYNKDFITAQGISDAFRAAEWCADAIDASLSGRSTFDEAMTRYQTLRDDASVAMYEFTAQFAALQPPTPDMQQLMQAIHGNQEAMNGFVRIIAGVVSPATFFSEENIGRIFAAARA